VLCVSGGSFLLKMFTMYEHETVCLMYLLCCAFNRVHVFKPATSKEGNSEVYVVCLEYKGRGIMEPWLEVFRKHFGKNMCPLDSGALALHCWSFILLF
jgi:23S rRNA methylase